MKLGDLYCGVNLLHCSNCNAFILAPEEEINQTYCKQIIPYEACLLLGRKKKIAVFCDFLFFLHVSHFINEKFCAS